MKKKNRRSSDRPDRSSPKTPRRASGRISVKRGGRAKSAPEDYQDSIRAKILTAAYRVYALDGYRAVSLRKVAKRLRFSAQNLYHYFPSKEAMFAALADKGLQLFERQHPFDELTDPLDNLRLPYLRYYEFSKAYSVYFTLLWMDPAAAVTEREPQLTTIRRMIDDTLRRIARCVDEGIFPGDLDIQRTGQLLFTAVHGPAVLGLKGWPPAATRDAIAADLLDAAIVSLRSGALARKGDPNATEADVSTGHSVKQSEFGETQPARNIR